MRVRWVSTGQPRDIEIKGKVVSTGIFKQPVDGQVMLRRDNLDGDGQADLRVHGGRDKAAYLYSYDYYAAWARDSGLSPAPALFGENLTVDGCRDEDVIIGSRYRIGVAQVLVTQPRIPCFKLSAKIGEPSFAQTFWEKGRLGFYVRVIEEGPVAAGDAIELLESPAHGIRVHDYWQAIVTADADAAARALAELPHLDPGAQRRLRNVANSQG